MEPFPKMLSYPETFANMAAVFRHYEESPGSYLASYTLTLEINKIKSLNGERILVLMCSLQSQPELDSKIVNCSSINCLKIASLSITINNKISAVTRFEPPTLT